MVVGDTQDCLDWGVDEDALGFHAICASVHNDETGDFDLDLPDDHQCYLSIGGLNKAVLTAADASVLEALSTLPHAMVHVALFARHMAGQTPLQVFDADGGKGANLYAALTALENEANAAEEPAGTHEGVVEAYARAAVDRWASTATDPAEPLLATLKAARPPTRRWRR